MAAIYEGNLLGIGSACALGGLTIAQLLPEYQKLGVGLVVVGGMCVMDYITHYSIFDRVFKNLKLGIEDSYPLLVNKENKDGYTLYEFTLPAGLSKKDFINKIEPIQEYIGKSIDISYGYKNLIVKVYNEKEKTRYDYVPTKLTGGLPILIGYDRIGNLTWFDLSEGEPHMYIAGTTGGGKSTALNVILTNLILFQDVELFLIDLKFGAEFLPYEDCSKVKGFAITEEEAIALLHDVKKEVRRRGTLIAQARCRNIKEYNKNNPPLKYQLLVIDELSLIMENKESKALLRKLSSLARFCGVHIIVATQRPSHDILDGTIKCNMTNILGFKTVDRVNSQVVIDRGGLEDLRGKGHGIFRNGFNETIVQCPYISIDEVDMLIAPFKKPKQLLLETKTKSKNFDFMEKIT